MNSKPYMTGISITDYERNIIEKVSKERGLYNFSAAVRVIVREWEEQQSRKLTDRNSGTEYRTEH